jgi:transcription antitermination factor NusG
MITLSKEKKWYAVYTKYKCEKLACDRLERKGVQCYVPLLTVTKRYTRKIKTYHKPLINCYIFVCIEDNLFTKVLQTDHVMGFLTFAGIKVPIPGYEIQTLQRVVGEFEDISLIEKPLKVGDEVEIISGNLTGIRGVFLEQKNKRLFEISLDHIGVTLKVDIDPALLRKIPRSIAV